MYINAINSKSSLTLLLLTKCKDIQLHHSKTHNKRSFCTINIKSKFNVFHIQCVHSQFPVLHVQFKMIEPRSSKCIELFPKWTLPSRTLCCSLTMWSHMWQGNTHEPHRLSVAWEREGERASELRAHQGL